jgi:cytoskeletal protein CcmA (bactofilin family)
MRFSLVFRILSGIVLLGAVSSAAFAVDSHDRTEWGHNITIGPGDEATELTCFGCSVRIRGHVSGDVTVFGGSIILEDKGEMGGDATAFAGEVRLEKDVRVGGDVTAFGGRIRRDSTAIVGGDVTNFAGTGWLVLVFGLPLLMLGALVALIVWLIRRLMHPAIPLAARSQRI